MPSAPEIEFQSAIVGRTEDGRVVIALIDGEPRSCVALLVCSREALAALCAQCGSDRVEPV